MFIISPLSGYKLTTQFTVSTSNSANNIVINWGDGYTDSDVLSAYHTYDKQGQYQVSVGDCQSTSAFNVSAFRGPFLENQIEISYTALSGYASCPTTFTINLSSTTEYSTIYLYSSGSKSIPYTSNRTFWTHLNPEWKFLDLNDNPINEIIIHGTAVYDNSATFLGYSAISSVKYVDDLPANVNLFFTKLMNDGNVGINSRVYASLNYSISSLIPTGLLITADGINSINEIQWADSSIPYLVSIYANSGCGTIVKNASGYLTDIQMVEGCYGLGSNEYEKFSLAINLTDVNCFPTGGYSLNSFVLPLSALPENTMSSNVYDQQCNINYDELEYTTHRTSPRNISLSAKGVFNVNGKIYTLSGVSTPFNVYKLENFHQFYRTGEDKSVYDLLNKFSHVDLEQTPILNSYLSAIAGEGDTLGKSYDKIINFNKDHSDIDICNIRAVKDISVKFDDPLDDYGIEFPEEMNRVMNFFSIPLQKLIGTRCVCNTNFNNCSNCCGKNICTVCNLDKRSNLGQSLTLNDYVSAGQTILVREHSGDVYEFLPIFTSSLVRDITTGVVGERGVDKFCYFCWDQTPQNNPVESVIDFLNPKTTLNRGLTSNDDWYGDNGVIEETLNYILTKNLINN